MPGDETEYTIHRFRQLEFTALTPLDRTRVHVQFKGNFNNKDILWDAIISTLNPSHSGNRDQTGEKIQAITIHPVDNDHYKINIELDVEIITEATVFKTMLMIHNYKKLKVGRHEFGLARSSTT